ADGDQVAVLKRLAHKLPRAPIDLTPKNKALLTQLESAQLRARLVFLPDDLKKRAGERGGRFKFVDAQVAVAIEILLAAPLRPENLSGLSWSRHLSEPDGAAGRL